MTEFNLEDSVDHIKGLLSVFEGSYDAFKEHQNLLYYNSMMQLLEAFRIASNDFVTDIQQNLNVTYDIKRK